MKLRNLALSAGLIAMIGTGALAGNGKPRFDRSSDQSSRASASQLGKIQLRPDLTIQARLKMSDIHGAPNSGFCAKLGNHTIISFWIRNTGKAESSPTTAKMTFSNAYNFAPNFHPATINVKELKPGERVLVNYPVPNQAWKANSNGTGYNAAFRIMVKAAEDEQVLTNNWVKYLCMGGPV